VSPSAEGLQIILTMQVGWNSNKLHPVTRFHAALLTAILSMHRPLLKGAFLDGDWLSLVNVRPQLARLGTPTPPRDLHGCEKKGVARQGIRIFVKTKGLEIEGK
jgi:hypothetical protein